VIEILLTCTECGRKSEPYEGRPIDTYSYHDAPHDAVMVDSPPEGWWVFDHDDGTVLCPDHSDSANVFRHRENVRRQQQRAWSR
jgi:hypothetical protein